MKTTIAVTATTVLASVALGSLDVAARMSVPVVNPATGTVSNSTLAALSAAQPVFLVGVNQTCPHMPEGIEAFNALHRSSLGRAAVVGVFNGSAQEARKYQLEQGIRFRLIADPDLNLIDALGIVRASEFQVIYQGKVLGKFEGFGQGTFEAAVAMAADATNRPKWQIPPGMPARPRAGCGF